MKLLKYLIPVILFVHSCNPRESANRLDEETYNSYREAGNSIASHTQAVLLSNVSGAIQEGGNRYAVEFCNLKASGITDSLNNVYNCTISRITNKKRNPGNGLEHDYEKNLFDYYLTNSELQSMHDTVIAEGSKAVYYKPIITALPACLQCHGHVADIDQKTYNRIRELYPGDEAVGYALNDLRGMWKIEFDYSINGE